MDAVVKQFQRDDVSAKRPSQKEAEEAVRTLLRYIGDDPDREGLKDTPRRVVKSYAEIYGGSNVGNSGAVEALELPSHGQPASVELTLPPLATIVLRHGH